MANSERWSALSGVDVPLKLVLVVDDEADAAAFVKSVFESHGATTRIAKDGGQAQYAYVMHKPDLVVLDLILPGESGFEICERLKHTDETVPILILSAIDMEDARDLALRVGADGYLTKPVAADSLWDTARDVVNRVWRRVHLGAEDESEPQVDRVRFNCVCGKKFKVSPVHRGKSMTCPQCGEPLIVPRR